MAEQLGLLARRQLPVDVQVQEHLGMLIEVFCTLKRAPKCLYQLRRRQGPYRPQPISA